MVTLLFFRILTLSLMILNPILASLSLPESTEATMGYPISFVICVT
jgi:hypothetical protein